jgi:hypothetical protein
MPANAGIQQVADRPLDSRLRGKDNTSDFDPIRSALHSISAARSADCAAPRESAVAHGT